MEGRRCGPSWGIPDGKNDPPHTPLPPAYQGEKRAQAAPAYLTMYFHEQQVLSFRPLVPPHP